MHTTAYVSFQLRIWCLQIPLPGMSHVIAAAKAILNSLKADELYRYSHDLIEGLIAWKIKIISYANDGTEVE
jgi:hypothetical protein